MDPVDGGSFKIWIVRRDAMIGAGCALFLLTTLLISWKRTLKGRTLVLTFVAMAALALTIPPEVAPIGAGLWMGLCCGSILRWLIESRKPTSPPSDEAAPAAGPVAARTVVALAVMLGLGSPWLQGAEQNPPSDDTTHATIYDVLVPIDDQQNPKGRELLVPEPLYQQLVQRAGRRTETSHDWLITRAMYQGRLGHGLGLAALGATDWTARYDLETFNRQVQLQIPFGGEGTNLVPDGVRLDGTPIQFEWRNSGRSLAIEIPEAGPHQLELAFRPSAQASNSAMVIDMAILPLANSQLQLELPADLQVEIPSAKGHLSRDQGGQRLVGSLGPAERLTVRWGDAAAFDSGPTLVDADELLWLKIRPGSVVLESRFDLRVAEGKLRQVQIVADPRLRRLPLEAGSPISQVCAESDGSNAIDLGLARPITDQVAFKVSFLLTDSSGIGNLQVPKLDIVGVRKLSRRLAVSIESPLETDEKSRGRLKALPVGDFLSAWGPPNLNLKWPFYCRTPTAIQISLSIQESHSSHRMTPCWCRLTSRRCMPLG